jgi:translation initiation factor IF-2
MSDANDENNGKGPRSPLTLKPRPAGTVGAGTVRQNFSHGRSKTVVVETKRRVGTPPAAAPKAPPPPLPRPEGAGAAPRPAQPQAPRAPASAGAAGGLSSSEMEARRRAIEAANAERAQREAEQRAVEARRRAEEDAQRRQQAEARAVAEAQARAAQPAPAPTPAPAQPQTPPPAAAQPRPAEAPAAPPPAPRPADPPRPQPTFGQRAPVERAPRPEPRPAPERPAAPSGERPAAREGGYGERPQGGGYGAPRGDRPQGGYGAPRGDRPQGGAGYGAGPRPPGAGYGAPRGDRPQGGGYGGPRGDRPQGGAGYGAGPRPQGAGYGAPRGDRPQGGGYGGPRGDRPQGGPGFAPRGDRPQGAGPGGAGGPVRYSALAPRPGGPGGPGGGFRGPRPTGGAGAPPAGPEFTRPSRAPGGGGGFRSADRRPADAEEAERARRARAAAENAGKAVSRTRGEPGRRQGRLTIQAVAGGDGDAAERMRSLASVRRAREREKEKRRGGGAVDQARVAREVVIPDVITVGELANRMATRGVEVIKFLMRQGMMLKINDVIDNDTAELVATEFGHTVRRVSEADVEEGFIAEEDAAETLQPRPPVVAVMGHVDHGKTSLLDALRSATVASGEAGGITQHIGAYQVRLESGERVTFLDTPGHAAFSAMRARGADVTDIVVLVVAADDGVMPQTIEAINHARSAGKPLIVAVNKMDKPGADQTRIVNELLQHEIVAESLGGDTQVVPVSALQKTGLDDLIEAILLQAEVLDLRANPDRSGEGAIIESKLDKGRGPVATVLVNRGTLKKGDIVVAGVAWGKVRALVDERGEQVPSAGPSEPVEILGLDSPPSPGETLAVVEDEARAREITEYRERVKRERSAVPSGASLADMMARLQNKKTSEVPLVVKGDVQGSTEAIVGALQKLGTEEVSARIIHSGVGGITESDVMLAKGAGASIVGFNVRASAQARSLAEREGVEIRYYAIIYDLLDDIKGVMSGLLAPSLRETFLGNAQVLQVFEITKVGKIAGCRVTEGVVRRGARIRILRDDVVIHDMGVLQTLKRFKDDVAEVTNGYECGMHFGQFQDIKEGDVIECFTVEEVKRSL